ncbi:unnamed protein product [Thlaspi arvense]|uniref:Uncharacterized protein n=1 Tax=Thlaspi arvense TaxID=13288 RepID=A0AAU9SDN5_THLAR|nr:unnamed protein product [Thlaspi arvense]
MHTIDLTIIITTTVIALPRLPLPSVLSLPTVPLFFPLLHYLFDFFGSKPISSDLSAASFSIAFSSLSLVWFGPVSEICFNPNFILNVILYFILATILYNKRIFAMVPYSHWGWREDNLMDIRKGKREEIDEEES